MLSNVKVGDKVRFHVEMLKDAPTVTHIEPVLQRLRTVLSL